MKVHIILDDVLTRKTFNLIKKVDKDSCIIVADKHLYNKMKEKKPDHNFIWIDLFEESHSNEKVELANAFANDLLSINPKLLDRGYNLPEFTVNLIFNNLVSILFNLISKLDEFVNSNEITSMTLYEGSPDEQYLGLTLAEGERPFRFLYKRSWFLNYFINQAFKKKHKIEWRNKTPNFYIKIANIIKPNIILFGKLLLLLKKVMRKTKGSFISDKALKENLHTLFVVRNPIQVEPLKPIYYEYEKRGESTPLFISLENYSNNRLQETLQENKVKYFDLYQLLSFKSLLSVFNKSKRIIRIGNKKTIRRSIKKYDIEIDYSKIANELSVYWFDVLLFKFLLERFENTKSNNIKNVINNETHGYYSAVEAEWARKNNVLSAGIQHVSISDVMLPRISRVDVMFMMSREITNQLSIKRKDEKFVYVGPVAYDHFFNTSKHTNQFKKLVIFSQPDDFKKDYFQIIEDVIAIIRKNELDIEINLKLHPREKDVHSFLKYKNSYDKFNIFTEEFSSSELIAESDLVLSIHSGTLMQSILIGTPSISINYDKRYNIKADYILDDVTKKVFNKEELEVQFMNLDELNEIFYYNRQKYLKDELENYNGNAAGKVYDYIQSYSP